MEAVPCKDKMDKFSWEQYKGNLNIPEDLLNKQVKGLEKELQEAVRERYEEDSNSEEIASNYTDEDIFEEESSSELENDEKEENGLKEKDEEFIDEE